MRISELRSREPDQRWTLEALNLQAADTLVIGLGNPILGDDGIGWRVVEAVEARTVQAAQDDKTPALDVDFECLAVGGLSLMEYLIGYRRAIIVDALHSGSQPNGTVSVFRLEELPNRAAGHMTSAHDTTLHNALQVGRSMGASLPEEVLVVAIEAEYVYDFSEHLTPPVAAAAPAAAEHVWQLIQQTADA